MWLADLLPRFLFFVLMDWNFVNLLVVVPSAAAAASPSFLLRFQRSDCVAIEAILAAWHAYVDEQVSRQIHHESGRASERERETECERETAVSTRTSLGSLFVRAWLSQT